MTPIDALIEQLLVREGGVADAGDGKGVTRWGQTPEWLAQFGLPTPVDAATAAANYMRWLDLTGLTPVMAQGDELASIVLDMAVKTGHRQAIKTLQTAMGVAVDGVIGPATLTSLAAADRRRLAADVIAGDMEYQGAVITSNPERAVDAKGWAARMAWHVRNIV